MIRQALILICVFFTLNAKAEVSIQNLRCESLSAPQGIDMQHPRLSWELANGGYNILQTGYQILVASSADKLAMNEGDVWNSGRILSGQSVQVRYNGPALISGQACYWKVRVWCNNGQESGWSNESMWRMGLLQAAEWNAKWIGAEHAFPWDSVTKFSRLSARYYRKEFTANKAIKSAVVNVCGLGWYEMYINGQRISNNELTPASTDFRKTVLYNTYDVTQQLSGKRTNALGVVLGNGRLFTMRQNYKPKKITTFGYPKLLLQLTLTFTDGSQETIVSDESWKMTADGPIRSNNEYDGEEYDARKEMDGWNSAGFNDANWLKPELVAAPGGKMVAQMNEPVTVMHRIKPVTITAQNSGNFILDMGQNFAGWLQMKVRGKSGDTVTLRFAETLQPDGSLYRANLRDAQATDHYILKGSGEETWHPSFVYHGFRYVEVTGYPGVPKTGDFEGQELSDGLEQTGTFSCSNPLLNQIYNNAVWTVRSDYKGLPLDCPQRNERMPWLGDRAVGCIGESFMMDNAKLYAKWLDDIEDAQTPDGAIPDVAPAYWNYYSDNVTWPATYLLVANMLMEQFADTQSVVKHYASMKKWMDYMAGKYMKDGLMTKDKYGDWCVPPETPKLIHSLDSNRNTDGVLIASAYYYHLLELMQRFALLQHLPGEAKSFEARKETLLEAFNRQFLRTDKSYYGNNTVTANLLPLYFGMVPEYARGAVFNQMIRKIEVDNKSHISTGVIGTGWLMRGLTDNGRADLAYKIATNDDYPSWGYMVKNGATTIWELWNGNTAAPQMNSGNHVMLLGDLITWMYEDIGGISASSSGFSELEMKPQPVAGLDFAKVSYQSIHGKIVSEWKKNGTKFEWHVTLPANTEAVIYVPAKSANDIQINNGKAAAVAHFKQMEGDRAVFRIGSGDYNIISNF